MKKYMNIICIVAAVCLLGAAAFCGYHIYDHYAQESEQEEAFEEIAEIVEQAQEQEIPEETLPDDAPVSEGDDVLAHYDTYRISGLPAGAITNPGIDAIAAALNPDQEYLDEGYYFFVTGNPNGDHPGEYFYQYFIIAGCG